MLRSKFNRINVLIFPILFEVLGLLSCSAGAAPDRPSVEQGTVEDTIINKPSGQNKVNNRIYWIDREGIILLNSVRDNDLDAGRNFIDTGAEVKEENGDVLEFQ